MVLIKVCFLGAELNAAGKDQRGGMKLYSKGLINMKQKLKKYRILNSIAIKKKSKLKMFYPPNSETVRRR